MLILTEEKMKNLTRVQNIEEPVYLKKGIFGYRVVHPTKNPDGSWNWLNVITGGWENLIALIIILLIIISFMYGVREMMVSCNDMAENPCKYTDLDCKRYYDIPQSLEGFDYGNEDVSLHD